MLKLFKELKRRKVLTTLGAYAAAAFVIIQLAGVVFPALRFPDWMMAFVILLIILGFPITFFLSWTYDLKREADDKLGPEDVPSVKKSNKLLLPITGFLTIIGGLFWFWYSLGDVTSGSDIDLQLGIKKTIAVFGFENLSGKKEDDHLCSGISLHIRDVLNKIGKLNVKARRFTLNNNPKVLDLDYYIDGVLSEVRGNRTIVVSIVNAKSETDLWSGQFKYNDKEILSIQDTIIKSILTELEIAPIGNEITSSAHVYKSQENFKLIGEGIYHYDKQNYTEAIKAFNSVLASDSENIVALYHKANSFFELDNFQEAMTIYKNILGQSIDIDPIQLRMSVPKRKGVHSILCENIELIEDKDLAIMLLRGDRGSRLVCFNTVSMEGVWDVDIDDPFVSSPVIINNIIYLSSNRFKKEQIGEPTLYAYNISNGKNTFIREFPRDNQDQTVLFTILEDYSNISDNNSTILLRFKKMGRNAESHRELALIETSSGGPVWEQKIEEEWGFWPDLVLINEGDLELLVLILENDIIALNNKTGNVMWRENFLGSALFLWNQKILKINQEEKYIALWDPTSRKEVWKSHDERVYAYYHKSGIIENSIDELKRRMNKDIILLNFTDGNLVAVNYDGGLFNWSRERWTRNIGFVEKIWMPENASNRVFCLTQDDTLFTINLTDGKIITRLATAGHDYRVYHDDSQNAMVLQNSEFLIGVDPINGNQLWKIKDSGVERAGLVGNSVLAAKTKLEDTLFLINAYNRDNGNLIWSKSIDISTSLSHLPSIVPICGTADCAFCSDFTFFLEHYSDKSLLLIFHDEIIKIGVIPAGNKAILQKDVRLQIARTHEKRGALDVAEEEYKLLLFQDQMNPFAHWELASLYQKKGRVNEAAKSLINYYDLILPESSEGTKTIQGLKDLKILKWNKNIPGDRFDVFKMGVDRDKIFLFINNNIETHSIYSSALIWKKSFGGENTSIISTDVKNEKYLFLIKKEVPDAKMFYLQDMLSNRRLDFEAYEKASKYFLSAMNKKDGKISWDVRLEIPGESSIVWMGVLNQKIIIQSIIQNQMLVSAYNAAGGGLLWKISRDISSLYTQYDLTLAFYKDILLLPLANSVEYINVDNGIYQGEYSDEDIDHILSFNESGIQNNTIKFFISEFENEYVEIDLDKNIKIADGLLDSDNPKMGMWINNVFIDVSTYGSVVAYELSENGGGDANVLWRDNYNTSLKLVGANEQNISLLDSNNEQIMVLDTRSGIVLQLKPLLWPGKNIEMTDRYYIVQSENKLYVVPM